MEQCIELGREVVKIEKALEQRMQKEIQRMKKREQQRLETLHEQLQNETVRADKAEKRCKLQDNPCCLIVCIFCAGQIFWCFILRVGLPFAGMCVPASRHGQ